MRVLIEAGADPNSRGLDGSTPLYITVQKRDVDATKVLLRARANQLLTNTNPLSGGACVSLDVAVENGHSEVMDELIQEFGIEGCGGVSGGVDALRWAAVKQHAEIMHMLTNPGVVDTGIAPDGRREI